MRSTRPHTDRIPRSVTRRSASPGRERRPRRALGAIPSHQTFNFSYIRVIPDGAEEMKGVPLKRVRIGFAARGRAARHASYLSKANGDRNAFDIRFGDINS